MHYVYVLKSQKNGKIYTGRSSNLRRRLKEHLSGRSYTTNRMKNIRLIFYEAFLSKKDSVRRERYFKTSKGRSSLKQIIRDSLVEE